MTRPKKDTLSIAPQLLLKLRENTGYSEEQAAKKADISSKELIEIEKGKKKATIKLIKKLSEAYEYPLVTFFEEKALELPHKLKDYRINRNKTISPEARKAERRAYYLINALQEISEERAKIPEYSERHTAVALAKLFRQKIRLEKPSSKKAEDALESYKVQLEDKLGIVITEDSLKNEDVRAFSISSEIPISVLNESDKPEIKLFSLFHELCHLIKRKSTICSIETGVKEKDAVELYCDKFASEILVPTEDIRRDRSLKKEVSQRNISGLSNRYFVSEQVIMIKLLGEDLITQERYSKFKRAFDKNLLEKKFGRKNWEKTYLKRVGRKVTETVRNAHRQGKISTADALDILNVKSKYAEKFIGEGGYDSSD